MNSLLSFQEGFEIDTNLKNNFEIPNEIPMEISFLHTNWKLDTIWKFILRLTQIPIEINICEFFLKWWCSPFALGLILLPFGIYRKKRRTWEPFLHFLPNGKINMSEGSYQLRVVGVKAKGKWYRQS
jgi:hypothetical protein